MATPNKTKREFVPLLEQARGSKSAGAAATRKASSSARKRSGSVRGQRVPAQPRRGRHPARLGNAPAPVRGQRVPAQPRRGRHPARLGKLRPVRRQAAARPALPLGGSKTGRGLRLRPLLAARQRACHDREGGSPCAGGRCRAGTRWPSRDQAWRASTGARDAPSARDQAQQPRPEKAGEAGRGFRRALGAHERGRSRGQRAGKAGEQEADVGRRPAEREGSGPSACAPGWDMIGRADVPGRWHGCVLVHLLVRCRHDHLRGADGRARTGDGARLWPGWPRRRLARARGHLPPRSTGARADPRSARHNRGARGGGLRPERHAKTAPALNRQMAPGGPPKLAPSPLPASEGPGVPRLTPPTDADPRVALGALQPWPPARRLARRRGGRPRR